MRGAGLAGDAIAGDPRHRGGAAFLRDQFHHAQNLVRGGCTHHADAGGAAFTAQRGELRFDAVVGESGIGVRQLQQAERQAMTI